MLYKNILRPILFQRDAEDAHEQALRWAECAGRSKILRDTMETMFNVEDGRLRQTVCGLEFPNPVGLAAGFDKNAVGVPAWGALGFGFVEVGSVTARAQPGNEKPRLWRFPEQEAVINRMGFNNDGAAAIARRVPAPPHRILIGVNIGKSKITPLEQAAGDYLESIRQFAGRADFFVINVSSPNTPGLRKLQDREMLDQLLAGVAAVPTAPVLEGEPVLTVRGSPDPAHRPTEGLTAPSGDMSVAQTARSGDRRRAACATPLLLKLAPDLTFDQMDDALDLAQRHGLAGIVATNTTINHPTPPDGGLSGAPLRQRATECVRHIHQQTAGNLPIIGVGGIFTAEDAYERIRAGASLVEVWTGLIYEGPAIARNINRGLLRLLERDGLASVAEAVGNWTTEP